MKIEFVKAVDLGKPGANQALYKLSEPVEWTEYDDVSKETIRNSEYVIISAVFAPFSGPETYIFPADADGKILSWMELYGSTKGTLSHDAAISNAGWELVS